MAAAIGIIGAARCGLLLAADPDDPERRILAPTKGNLGRPPASPRLPPDAPLPVATSPASSGTARATGQPSQLLRESASGVASRSLLTEAQEWLRAALADGPRPPEKSCATPAKAGIGRNLLYAARKLEGVFIGKERVADGRWVWSYPAAAGELPGRP